MEIVVGLIAVVAVLALYFLPAIIANRRNHHNENAIAVLNLLLGWTFIGWVVALVWSVSAIRITPSEPLLRS